MNHVAWATAFAFVGMMFAIAYGAIHFPDRENPSVACVKAGETGIHGDIVKRSELCIKRIAAMQK